MTNDIIWTYAATEQRVKAKNLVRYILGAAFHITGPIFALVVFFDFQEKQVLDIRFATILGIVYLADLAIWYGFMNNLMKFKERNYVISASGIEIVEVATGKKKSYRWDQLSSFSRDIRVYAKDPESTGPSENSEQLYLGYKSAFNPYIVLDVEPAVAAAVQQILKSKLEEKEYAK